MPEPRDLVLRVPRLPVGCSGHADYVHEALANAARHHEADTHAGRSFLTSRAGENATWFPLAPSALSHRGPCPNGIPRSARPGDEA
jgi:hypothetical protein